MDPQERLFLQTAWHALEDAGYTRERLRAARAGVFVGVMYGQYQLYGVRDALRGSGLAASSSRLGGQPRVVLLRLHRPEHGRGHHVLVVPDAPAPGGQASAPASATRPSRAA